MPVVRARIAAAIGLHARPAAQFVRAVAETLLPVTITQQGQEPVDARSLLEVMTADFTQGTEVVLGLDDERYGTPEALAILESLRDLLESQE
ncbi:phosphocarrier protein HPr [Arthrobacter woluwensis]|uniref:HPr family phosphocarrier protein n=1 Tax=Arthrobacter woluwensis TaxID=156980 RepID=UPI002785914A|nr:HPr family phosphocarrier protein [Arthrobacter woluwensis]MDQ0708707.1 phosphocarrier protein HPr [Arthrobacter woluwensis]